MVCSCNNLSKENPIEVQSNPRSNGPWCGICLNGPCRDCSYGNFGRADRTRLWEDLWLGVRYLKDKFPRLYLLSEQKNMVTEEYGI